VHCTLSGFVDNVEAYRERLLGLGIAWWGNRRKDLDWRTTTFDLGFQRIVTFHENKNIVVRTQSLGQIEADRKRVARLTKGRGVGEHLALKESSRRKIKRRYGQ
jgi:hypothetical protein